MATHSSILAENSMDRGTWQATVQGSQWDTTEHTAQNNFFTKQGHSKYSARFVVVQALSHVWLFAAPRTATRHVSLSFTISWSLCKLTSIESVIPSSPQLSPSPPAFSLSQNQGLFQWVSSSYQVAKVLKLQLQHQSFRWIFRVDLL